MRIVFVALVLVAAALAAPLADVQNIESLADKLTPRNVANMQQRYGPYSPLALNGNNGEKVG